MGEIVNFPNHDKASIEIIKSDSYMELVVEMSDFIQKLPLSTDDNDKLVNLILEQTRQAQLDAFRQGIQVGLDIAKFG